MREDRATKLGYRSAETARGNLSKAGVRPETARAGLQTPGKNQEIGAAWGAVMGRSGEGGAHRMAQRRAGGGRGGAGAGEGIY